MFTFYFFQDIVIQTEDEIRVKIVGTRVDATDIVSVVIEEKCLFCKCVYLHFQHAL